MGLDEIIRNCQKNDRKAQEQLYRLFVKKLFTVCLKYSRNYEEGQDNLQEGFIIIFKKISQYNFKGSFEGWTKRIMINTCLQQYRQISFLDILNENTAEEVEVEIENDSVSMDFLMKIIQELPDRYRLVFSLYVLDGYTHKEIAEMLDINEGTSKSNLSRARIILKGKIDEFSDSYKNKKKYNS
ncbi:RNA polymerase sigma factor [Flavobacterium orientale]|uniref:DNA-directed RNA polymerase sigma-70 factor n=1 Tax=Flavobacterium orientale TaxID=1756020 RepID=A0A917DBA3_9FLAO|nr:RNA polymerase sigma factor [Flavobacterium orientale]GGD23106.1 DNA-directed RNA polymerase sigma-70 factor [Flavobacterium orientale]